MKHILALVCPFAIACSSSTDRLDVEANDLGITVLDVQHLSPDDEDLLVVRGLDDRGEELARASLRTGRVHYDADNVPEGIWTFGTALSLSAGEQHFSDIAPDTHPHRLAVTLPARIAKFTALRAVADAIEREAGITFAPPALPAERSYSGGGCPSNMFPTDKGGSDQCCLGQNGDVYETFHKIGGTIIADRWAYSYGAVCRNEDGTNCTGRGCSYGPCGFHSYPLNGPNVVVFFPHSLDACGWDVDADNVGYDDSWPENYDNQEIAPYMYPSCDCNDCVDGTAVRDGGACSHW